MTNMNNKWSELDDVVETPCENLASNDYFPIIAPFSDFVKVTRFEIGLELLEDPEAVGSLILIPPINLNSIAEPEAGSLAIDVDLQSVRSFCSIPMNWVRDRIESTEKLLFRLLDSCKGKEEKIQVLLPEVLILKSLVKPIYDDKTVFGLMSSMNPDSIGSFSDCYIRASVLAKLLKVMPMPKGVTSFFDYLGSIDPNLLENNTELMAFVIGFKQKFHKI
jgi:hypothetical protein